MPKYVETTTQLHSSHTLQSNAQNSPSEASMVHELRTSRCTSWIRKDRGTRDQIANIHWIIEKAREFQKNIYLCFIDYPNSFVWITTNCGKFFKRWEYQTILPVSWEICMQVKEQQLESDISNHLEPMDGSKLGKEYIKALYCHLAYLMYMQSTSCEMPGWMKYKLESKLPGGTSVTSDMPHL